MDTESVIVDSFDEDKGLLPLPEDAATPVFPQSTVAAMDDFDLSTAPPTSFDWEAQGEDKFTPIPVLVQGNQQPLHSN
jgi:hypothetical protein